MPRYLRRILEDEGFVSSRTALSEACHDPEELQALFARSQVAADVYKDALSILNSPEEKQEEKIKRAQRILNAEKRKEVYGQNHSSL